MVNDKYLPSSHFRELFSISLLDDVGDVVIHPRRRQRSADREQRVHAVRSLVDLVVLVAAGVILPHPKNKVQDRDEGPNGIGVSAEHNVAEANVVIGGNMASGDTSEWRFLVKLDVFHDFQSQSEIAEETVNAEQADDTEVSKHTVKRAHTVLANEFTKCQLSRCTGNGVCGIDSRNLFLALSLLQSNYVLVDF